MTIRDELARIDARRSANAGAPHVTATRAGIVAMDYELLGVARVTEGRVRSQPLAHLPELLMEFGVECGPVLSAAGLTRDHFADPENTMTVEQGVRLMILCAERTRQPHFGLLAGQRALPKQYGPVGLQMYHASSVGAAWRGLILNLHLNGRAVVPALTVRGPTALLSFSFFGDSVEGFSHLLDFVLAAACNAMRLLCGPDWAPMEVHLAHRAPVDVRPYQKVFRADLHFGAARSALVFPAFWLERRIEDADPGARRILQIRIARMLALQNLEFPTRVRRALFMLIAQDDVSIEGTARLLNMHKRTLNRRLAEFDLTFAKVLAEVRFQLARQLLRETDLPLVEIAATLNYTDSSTFSRAFRSWAGTTPSAWRQANAI